MGSQRENVRPSHQRSVMTVAWQKRTSAYTRLIRRVYRLRDWRAEAVVEMIGRSVRTAHVQWSRGGERWLRDDGRRGGGFDRWRAPPASSRPHKRDDPQCQTEHGDPRRAIVAIRWSNAGHASALCKPLATRGSVQSDDGVEVGRSRGVIEDHPAVIARGRQRSRSACAPLVHHPPHADCRSDEACQDANRLSTHGASSSPAGPSNTSASSHCARKMVAGPMPSEYVPSSTIPAAPSRAVISENAESGYAVAWTIT